MEHCSHHYSGAQADDNCTGYDSETSSDDMGINAGQRMLRVFYCSSGVHVLHFNTACNMYFVGIVQLLMAEKENSSSASFYPFPSKLFALLYLLVHRP